MECKVWFSICILVFQYVLIETSWNVKRGQAIATPVENIVLIETSWNVKLYTEEIILNLTVVIIETSWNVKSEMPKSVQK